MCYWLYIACFSGGTATITATITPPPSNPSNVTWEVAPANLVDVSNTNGLSISVTAKDITQVNWGGGLVETQRVRLDTG